MDEPCSALDPISTLAIEDLIQELKAHYTIVIVTHNMQQAARVSDRTAFFNIAGTGKPGKLIEMDATDVMFSNPEGAGHQRLHLRPVRLSHRPSGRPRAATVTVAALLACCWRCWRRALRRRRTRRPGLTGTVAVAGLVHR